MAKKATLDSLAAQIEKGFAAVAGDISDMRKDMANKDELGKLDVKADGLKVKIEGIQNTLDAEAVARTDQKIPERVAGIEKHLGINKKIAA